MAHSNCSQAVLSLPITTLVSFQFLAHGCGMGQRTWDPIWEDPEFFRVEKRPDDKIPGPEHHHEERDGTECAQRDLACLGQILGIHVFSGVFSAEESQDKTD